MAEWAKRKFRKGDIDRAGEGLLPWWRGEASFNAEVLVPHYEVVQNWRSCHAFPLNTFQMRLRQRARRIDGRALIAQRLKRFVSVMNKLQREPNMKLSQMQDLGGCRAILTDVEHVYSLFDLYRGSTKLLFETEGALKAYDYLANPKPDGYRGIHIVGRYRSDRESSEVWNGQRIEVQLRSRAQHSFATTVETVTTFTGTGLKFGTGPDDWRRFFSLMGSVLAIREKTAPVPDTPSDPVELVEELRGLSRSLKVIPRLRHWTQAIKTLPRQNVKTSPKWLLLVLNLRENTINVTGYKDRQKGEARLAEIEQQRREDVDAVLVWVDSAKNLRAAYPNYYADTRHLIEVLLDVLRRGL